MRDLFGKILHALGAMIVVPPKDEVMNTPTKYYLQIGKYRWVFSDGVKGQNYDGCYRWMQ